MYCRHDENLAAFDIFEMRCLHSAFVYTGAFRNILINNLQVVLKEKMLHHIHQKYAVEGELVVGNEDQLAKPIQLKFGNAEMHAWCRDENEIEFSIVAEKFQDTRMKFAVLDFMSDIAMLLNMPISLSDEGSEDDPWLVLNPDNSMKIPDSV